MTTVSDLVLGPLASDLGVSADPPQDQAQDEQAQDDKKKDKSSGEDESVNVALRLINTGPINLDQQIDEPVTSGNDVNVDFDIGPPPASN